MKNHILAALAAAALAACGGGGNDGSTKTNVASVKAVGASLADSGTFNNRKFTVQPGTTGTTYAVYTERIAATYNRPLCNAYSTTTGASFTANAGCTNFAVAGARLNYTTSAGAVDETSPLSGVKQLTDAGTAGYGADDLLIVGELSANDTAAFVEAYLGAQTNPAAFQALLLTLLPPATVAANSTNVPLLGTLYMQALATKMTTTVKAQAIDKGARRVAILNTLDVTRTPRFVGVIAQLTAAVGATQAAQVQALIRSWIGAYNTQLDTNVAALGSGVVVVDFFTNFNNEMNDPVQYGLNDVTGTVCDQVVNAQGTKQPAVVSLSTPSVMGACTDVNASALTPSQGADGTSNWWKKYLYADNFHPTPYGHQLLGQMVAKRLTEAGWL